MAGFVVHVVAPLGADFESSSPTPLSGSLFMVAIFALSVACVGALTAFIGMVGLVTSRRIRDNKRCFSLACGAVIGPLYLVIVYGSLFLLEL